MSAPGYPPPPTQTWLLLPLVLPASGQLGSCHCLPCCWPLPRGVSWLPGPSRAPPCPQEADWRARESAILALGAVAEGCHLGLVPYLGGMTAMLVPKLSDPQPMVRAATQRGAGRGQPQAAGGSRSQQARCRPPLSSADSAQPALLTGVCVNCIMP